MKNMFATFFFKMKLNKIEPKFIKKNNPRIGLITLASDFRIEKDFNDIIYGKDIDLYSNRINCYNPLTNETLKKMADDIPEVTKNILPYQKLDCVAYGCTSGTIAAGYQSIYEKVNLAKPNTKVIELSSKHSGNIFHYLAKRCQLDYTLKHNTSFYNI